MGLQGRPLGQMVGLGPNRKVDVLGAGADEASLRACCKTRYVVRRFCAINATSLVPDNLWEAIALLPEEPPKPQGGRPRVPDRAALGRIIFVLRKSCPWRLLPKELGCGSGTTCWRRLRDWQAAGVWQRLHETLLNWLGDEAAIDWSRASVGDGPPGTAGGRGGRGACRHRRGRDRGEGLTP